ncbi:hypothetical protein D5F01_LYC05718 [Scomber scombrus]|uniref:Uncharacterized protein n=1 Tax=Scomber scombrus TaxID=13677 RepID=A0AAV1PGH6_SCOSC
MADCGELQKKRSYAQGTFTRRANANEFNMDLLNEHDLKLELRALKGSYEEICNSSFDYIAVMEEEDASQFGSLKTDLEEVFGQAEALLSGHLTHEQYDLVHTALEGRVEALEGFVRDWDLYVPDKEVDDMRV